jgi:hypothetical protein
MYIAQNTRLCHILSAAEIDNYPQKALQQHLACPLCGKDVTYNRTADHLLQSFDHRDGSPDCVNSDAYSDGHRLAVEACIKKLHNRLRETTGRQVNLEIEKWIGSPRDFSITDIRITNPLKIAVEVFHQSSDLGLSRRLGRMFREGYRVYLIFTTNGRHSVAQVNNHIQKISPLRVGRFDPGTMEVTLGDLFSRDRIQLNQPAGGSLPNYLM